jgi:hypothetical protein
MADGRASASSIVLNTTRTGDARNLAVSGGPFKAPQVLLACAPIADPAQAAAVSAVEAAKAVDARLLATQSFDVKLSALTAKGWREAGQVTRITEPLPGDDGARSYYFRPGEADPFLVRDAQGAYAFEGGKLSAVFSREGAPLQPVIDKDRMELEVRFVQRGRDLKQAADAAAGAKPGPGAKI